ncbi:MAG: pyridoxal phosphate-dependent aminotransferase [Calditrichaeota bacterium]|nr:pyridoxal phosphate-dependent aminotransferase [Calditrichota bacterium]
MKSILDQIQVSGIVQIRDRLLKLDNPLRLESGEPSFDTPQHIKEAAIEAMAKNETHYVNSQGIVPLRTALTRKLAEQNGMQNSEADVLITNGGMHALYAAFSAITEEGDEIIIPTPNWTCVQWLITMTGAIPVHAPLLESNEFRFDLDQLESLIGPKTKAILINSPHNPTGAILTPEDLSQLLAIAERHNLFIISDEAYEHITYDDFQHTSIASLAQGNPELLKQIISVYTFSKSYAMTGWRLGYAVTSNAEVLSAMKKVVLYSANGINSVTQWAGLAAISGEQKFLAKMKSVFKHNRDLLLAGIQQSKLLSMTYTPKGAFYCFPKISDNWDGYEGDKSDVGFANYLIDNGKLGCTPGSIFGPGGNGFIRFSYACSTQMVEAAVENILRLA